MDRAHNVGRGFAYVEYETADEAENAMKHMDGGMTFYFHVNGSIGIVQKIDFEIRPDLG